MPLLQITTQQLHLVESSLDSKIFLEGPAGTGKTTAGVERVLHMMAAGVRGDSILLLAPQRTLLEPYTLALRHPGVSAGGMVAVLTVAGLAQRSLDLFWPLAAEQAGFARPDRLPTFLTLETAQYYMARLVRPLLDQGCFDSVAIDRNRLYSQVLDNLNKAALVGFPHTEIGARLKSAWIGETAQARIYDDAQECANRFRRYCLEHNLLDFSLQLEVFFKHVWPAPLCREYLQAAYRHLVMDNLEEDAPAAHDMLEEWLPQLESALLIYDHQAGYRSFLGADPERGYELKSLCDRLVTFEQSFVNSPEMEVFGEVLKAAIPVPEPPGGAPVGVFGVEPLRPQNRRDALVRLKAKAVLEFEYHRYFPQMIDWVGERIAGMVCEEGVPPNEIVVLAPFMSDALRFALTDQLERSGVTARSHRPSRALREEPAAQCMLTLAALAHPGWSRSQRNAFCPTRFDVAYAFILAIEELDLVRAQILSEIVYRVREGAPTLTSFDRIRPEMQERVTFVLGQRYQGLYEWLSEYAAGPEQELDYFFSRLFGEVLSQPGYGFHRNFNAGETAANLVESTRKFRWAVGDRPDEYGKPPGLEYLEMVQDGVVASQYLLSWRSQPQQAVLLAPAYTFLMSNRPVDYQFWIDVGSRGWSERLDQPLTHPYVLSRGWPPGDPWTDEHEYAASQAALYRLAAGLARRCRRKIYLGLSELSEQGYEHHGPLLMAVQRVLRSS